MKKILMILMFLASGLLADDYKMVCIVADMDDFTKQVNTLMKQGYELVGPHTQFWVDNGVTCKLNLCQSMVKKDKKIAKAKPKIKHEYWIVSNMNHKDFSRDVESMLNDGWSLVGPASFAIDRSGNWLVQTLVKDTEIVTEGKKP